MPIDILERSNLMKIIAIIYSCTETSIPSPHVLKKPSS